MLWWGLLLQQVACHWLVQVRLYQFSDSSLIWKKGSYLHKNGHVAVLTVQEYVSTLMCLVIVSGWLSVSVGEYLVLISQIVSLYLYVLDLIGLKSAVKTQPTNLYMLWSGWSQCCCWVPFSTLILLDRQLEEDPVYERPSPVLLKGSRWRPCSV